MLGSKKSIVLTVLLSFFVTYGIAQRIEGVLMTYQYKPIPRASVIVSDSMRNIVAYALTDAKGRFVIARENGLDSCSISFSAMNYEGVKIRVRDFQSGAVIKMAEKTLVLKDVEVVAEPMMRNGDTISYRVGSFKRARDRSIEDVIAQMPGLRVGPDGTVYYQGRAIKDFYIDGMDMMGNNYSQATRNISADHIESVQVYEHYEGVKALHGMQESDEVALNIKLKGNARNIWMGNADAAAGTPFAEYKDFLRQWRLSPMFFARGLQTLSLYKGNNVGTDLKAETERTESTGAYNPIRGIGAAIPFTDKKRSMFNNSHLLASNLLYKPRKDTDIRFQLAAFFDRDESFSHRETHFADLPSVCRDEETSSDAYSRIVNANFKYEQNNAKYLLANCLSGNIDWSHSRASTVLNTNKTVQHAEPHDLRVSDQLKYVARLANKHSLVLLSSMSYAFLPASLLLFSKESQETKLRNYSWQNRATYMFRHGRLYLSATMEGSFLLQDFQVESPDTTARNLYREACVQLRPTLSYTYRLLHLGCTPRFLLLNRSLEHQHHQCLRFIPEASVTFDNHGHFTHNLNFVSGVSASQLLQITDIPYYQNYSYKSSGSGDLELSEFQLLTLSSSYREMERLLTMNATVSFMRHAVNSVYENNLDGDGLLTRTAHSKESNNDSYTVSLGMNKHFRLAKANLAIDGSYTLYSVQMLKEGRLTPRHIKSSSFGGTFSMSPCSLLAMDAGLRYSRRKSRLASLQEGGHVVENIIASLNVYLQHGPWQTSIMNWCSTATESSQNTVWFTDFKLSYKRNNIEATIEMKNIWNQEKIIRRDITDYGETYSIFRLRPREVIASLGIML